MALGATNHSVEEDPEADVSRTAFTLGQVYERRDGLRITAVALDHAGESIFLGLVNGQLEEHRLLHSASGPPTCRFAAEKRVFRRPIAHIACLPHAHRLALLSGDGQVALCTLESFDVVALPGVKNAVGLAADAAARYPERLAVATRSTKRNKLLVFAVVAGGQGTGTGHGTSPSPVQLLATIPVPDPIQGLGWVGRHIFLAVSGGYLLASSDGGMVVLAQQLVCPTMVAPVPDAGLAVLLFEETMALVTDDKGTGVREPVLLPSRPLALTNCGFYMLAVGDDGIHVFDRDSSRQVQFIDFQHDDAWVATSKRIACASDLAGRHVVLATSNAVWCLSPVALEQQTRELLKRRKFNQAIQLAEMCLKQGATWVEAAWAQAGLLLLQELQFAAAVRVLSRCSPESFQPAELLPLFPSSAGPWMAAAPLRPHWGLHAPLRELRAMLQDRMDGMERGGSTSPVQLPAPPDEVQRLEREAKGHVVHYLLQVRQREGVQVLAGVDTLALRLLCDIGDAAALEAFVAGDTCADLAEAEGALTSAKRWHALALMRSAHGRAKDAVDIWQRLGQGQLVEAPSSSGAVAAAGGHAASVAVEFAGRAMMAADRLGAEAVLGYLPWLLQQSPTRALDVLKSREDLPVRRALGLLVGPSLLDLRWRFLHHAVYQRTLKDAQLHTELAVVMVDAARQAAQQVAATAAEPAPAPLAGSEEPSTSSRASLPPGLPRPPRPPPEISVQQPVHSSTSRPPPTHSLQPLHTAFAPPPTPSGSALSPTASGVLRNLPGSAPNLTPAGSGGSLARTASGGSQGASRSGSLGGTLPRSVSSASAVMSRTALAAAVADAHGEAALRALLQAHLTQSTLYDAQLVLQMVAGTTLWQEQVLLHSRLSNHQAALRILALTMRDVDAALAYCARCASQEVYMDLLEMCLRPGDGQVPMYPAAVRVLNAEGANLNPLKVLQSLSDDMPLHLAVDTLARMVAGSTHRGRHLAITRNLHRAQNLNARVERAELQSQKVVVTEETTCRGCQRLLGSKVFYRYPSGVILCSRCAKPGESSQ